MSMALCGFTPNRGNLDSTPGTLMETPPGPWKPRFDPRVGLLGLMSLRWSLTSLLKLPNMLCRRRRSDNNSVFAVTPQPFRALRCEAQKGDPGEFNAQWFAAQSSDPSQFETHVVKLKMATPGSDPGKLGPNAFRSQKNDQAN